MNTTIGGPRLAAIAVLCVTVLAGSQARAFRMIQNTSPIRTSTGFRVACDDPLGFAHRMTTSISWRLNTAGQGSKPGVVAALQNAMASWNSVAPATYTLSYAGTTGAGFVTDGINTVLWASGNGCTGGCLALTALVLAPGQAITEADVSFNDAVTWNTNGTDYDVEAIAAHELGHSLGIHHTELTKPRDRPTMYAYYFGIAGRSLETDDRDALNCAFNRYPPGLAPLVAGIPSDASAQPANHAGLMLTSRPRPGGAILRFALASTERVRLELFDVAGRELATLVNDVRDAGDYEVPWDGATGAGRASSGIYFARIVTPEGAAHASVILAD